MVPVATSLVGFSGEIKWPLGQIKLLVKVGDDEHSTSTWMDFMVVRSTSPYNGIIGRPGLQKMKAVLSTTHGMIKFPVMGGTLTLRSSKIIPIECATVSGPEDQPSPMNKVEEERIKVIVIVAMATKFEIEKFNGNNFSLWKLKMKAILRKDKCLAAIGERPAKVTDDSKWDKMDGNAIANLHLALADGVLSSIEEKKTAREIWDHLARLYEARTLHNKIFLKRKLYALRMTKSTSVTEHVNNLNTLFSQLTSLDCKIDPQERAKILLQSLPDSYNQVIINLTSNVLTDCLVFDDVAASVLEEENRRNNREDRQTSSRQVETLAVTLWRAARERSMETGL
ncbi:hypothetical protein Tco_0650552 [Tanacetum coccineum]